MSDIKSQVLELFAEGFSTQEIAERLGVSWQTVAGYKGAYPVPGSADDAGLEEVETARNLKFGLERDMQDAAPSPRCCRTWARSRLTRHRRSEGCSSHGSSRCA